MQHAGHHPEQVQLLRVVQADLLHGYAHAVEVAVVVQQRVLQRARLHVLRNQDRVETVTDCWLLPSAELFQASIPLIHSSEVERQVTSQPSYLISSLCVSFALAVRSEIFSTKII